MNEIHKLQLKKSRLKRCKNRVKDKITQERRQQLLDRIAELEKELQ